MKEKQRGRGIEVLTGPMGDSLLMDLQAGWSLIFHGNIYKALSNIPKYNWTRNAQAQQY